MQNVKELDAKIIEKALSVAKEVRKNAYAPYSKFHVGAALIHESGEIIPGCNVENASYGGTICAERNAFFHAVAKFGGKPKFQGIVLITEPLGMPCGMCLQVMAEFFQPETPIIIANEKAIQKRLVLKDLLPLIFDPKCLG